MNSIFYASLEKLDRHLDHLLKDLDGLHDEVLNRQPEPGAWSPLQVMQHLIMSEERSLQTVKKRLSQIDRCDSIGFLQSMWCQLLWLGLKSPFRFKAPAAVSENLPERASLEEVAGRWMAHRSDLRQTLEPLDSSILKKALYRHPSVGNMTLPDMLHFFESHFVRHRHQIDKALQHTHPAAMAS